MRIVNDTLHVFQTTLLQRPRESVHVLTTIFNQYRFMKFQSGEEDAQGRIDEESDSPQDESPKPLKLDASENVIRIIH